MSWSGEVYCYEVYHGNLCRPSMGKSGRSSTVKRLLHWHMLGYKERLHL